MENHGPLVIRPARKDDSADIVALGQKAMMGTLDGFDETLVACFDDHTIAGFCRIRTIDGIAYVNPVVVDESMRRKGIGATLMETARNIHGELRFVARGGAVAFYRSLACDEIPWSEIHREIARDCDDCEDFDSCHPLPMRMPPCSRPL